MADKYLLEAGTDGYLMEDSGGVLLLEGGPTGFISMFSRFGGVVASGGSVTAIRLMRTQQINFTSGGVNGLN